VGAVLVRGSLGLLALLGLARMSALDLPLWVWVGSVGAWMLVPVADGGRARTTFRAGAAPLTMDSLEVNDVG